MCVCGAQMWSYPVEERNVVEHVRVGEGKNTEIFAELWRMTLGGPEIKDTKCTRHM